MLNVCNALGRYTLLTISRPFANVLAKALASPTGAFAANGIFSYLDCALSGTGRSE